MLLPLHRGGTWKRPMRVMCPAERDPSKPLSPPPKGPPTSGRGDASRERAPRSHRHATTQPPPSFKNKKLLQHPREDHRSERPAELSALPLPPPSFGPYCDKPLGCKTIKMLITSHQEAQPLILIYELPTFKARCSSDRVLRRWSRVPVFNSPLQAAGALSIANTPRHTGRARVCKSTGAGIALPVWCGSLSQITAALGDRAASPATLSVLCALSLATEMPCY